MDTHNVTEITGLNALNGDLKAAFFRQIWNASTHQMCLAKMVLDEHDAPVDYIILDINPAYEKEFGFVRDEATNKLATEIFPVCASKWIEKCGEAMRYGMDSLSFEYISSHNQSYKYKYSRRVREICLLPCLMVLSSKTREKPASKTT